ncbi:hypothetical protein [Pedobacter antarcticus]|uniref:hypothetical protein n=1 Tax=Pedobacter antarcticus TaxID=34086 RepID=UPI00088DD8A7|nr:hypothetical protein [Pedobacter antarcticus]SDL83901.1 hypothetical protein SAMN04488084_102626 [Pedobacter antarcticus]
MNLITLIGFIVVPVKLEEFYIEHELDMDSEALIIYMKESLSMESEIYIYPIEETDDDLVYEKNGIKFIQFFPLDYALELINSDLQLMNKGLTDRAIAERLLEYRLKDA